MVLCELRARFSGCPSAGSSQPLAVFYSAPVLISLRWHGGEVDLIIVMVAGGSQWLQTSAAASHIRVLRRLCYSSCFTTGLPRASFPYSITYSPGFLWNQNYMRCKFTGKLRSPFGSGSKTFSRRTTRWNGEWTVAAAAPPRDGLCVVTVECLLTFTQPRYCWFSTWVVVSSVALLLNSVWGSFESHSGWLLLCSRKRVVWNTTEEERRDGQAPNRMTARLAAL